MFLLYLQVELNLLQTKEFLNQDLVKNVCLLR